MPRPRNPVPRLEHHTASDQGVVCVYLANNTTRDLYCGKWNSKECRDEYARIIAILAANDGVWPSDGIEITVAEALVRYAKHIDVYYQNADGTVGDHAKKIKYFLRPLKTLYAKLFLSRFGPMELKTIRSQWVSSGMVRNTCNKGTNIVRKFFRWCAEEQLCPASVWDRLRTVESLQKGRGGVVESEERQPADPKIVEKTLPYLSQTVQQIILVLRYTGVRPDELLQLKPCDFDRSGDIWTVTLAKHKTSLLGKVRTLYFGPQAQEVLLPTIASIGANEYLFSPAREEAAFHARRSANRKTKRYPSHMKRNADKRVKKRRCTPKERYFAVTVAKEVKKACERAGCPPWTPYMLRHLVGAELREKYGLEHVRAVLGHSYAAMSAHYAKGADEKLALKAMGESG